MHKSLSLHTIAKFFQIDLHPSTKVQSSYAKTGPGEFDPWLLLENREDICLQSVLPFSSKKTKKMIISDGLLKLMLPSDYTIALFSLLWEHFELYLWPGNNKPLVDCLPLSSTHEFWERRHSIIAADEKEIFEKLAEHHLSAD